MTENMTVMGDLLSMWPVWISLALLVSGPAIALYGRTLPPLWRLYVGLTMFVSGAAALPLAFWLAWRLAFA